MRKLDRRDILLASFLFPQILGCLILYIFMLKAYFAHNTQLFTRLATIINADLLVIAVAFFGFKKKTR